MTLTPRTIVLTCFAGPVVGSLVTLIVIVTKKEPPAQGQIDPHNVIGLSQFISNVNGKVAELEKNQNRLLDLLEHHIEKLLFAVTNRLYQPGVPIPKWTNMAPSDPILNGIELKWFPTNTQNWKSKEFKNNFVAMKNRWTTNRYYTNLLVHTTWAWRIQTNWLTEPKDRMLLGPFPRTQRFLEYGIVQSNLIAELVYKGRTNLVTLQSTPAMSITREYDVTITPRP